MTNEQRIACIDIINANKFSRQEDIAKGLSDQQSLLGLSKASFRQSDISIYFQSARLLTVKLDNPKEKYLRYIQNCNGINTLAYYNLVRAQGLISEAKTSGRVFPNQTIYKISEKALMLLVRPKRAHFALNKLSALLTRRYLYYIALNNENLITLYLTTGDDDNPPAINPSVPASKKLEVYRKNQLFEDMPTDKVLDYEELFQVITSIIAGKELFL